MNGAELPECARAVSAVLVCFIHTALYSSGSTWPTSPHSSHDGTLPIRAPSRQGHLRLVVELVRRDLLDAEELVIWPPGSVIDRAAAGPFSPCLEPRDRRSCFMNDFRMLCTTSANQKITWIGGTERRFSTPLA